MIKGSGLNASSLHSALAFGVQRLAFRILRLAFGIRHLSVYQFNSLIVQTLSVFCHS